MTTYTLTIESIGEERTSSMAKEAEDHRVELIAECEDCVDEQVDETFPCSDPPAHGGFTDSKH